MNATERINKLIEKHGATFYKCKGCDICTEIQQLKDEDESNAEKRYKAMLEKGRDLTKSEITKLLHKGIDKRTIQKALHMGGKQFDILLDNWGIDHRRFEKEDEEIVLGRRKFDKNNIELLKTLIGQKKTDEEIGQELNVARNTIWYWKKKLNLKKAK